MNVLHLPLLVNLEDSVVLYLYCDPNAARAASDDRRRRRQRMPVFVVWVVCGKKNREISLYRTLGDHLPFVVALADEGRCGHAARLTAK